MEKNLFHRLKEYVIYLFLFLFPLFFLPFTQEYFITHKFYLLIITTSILLSITTLEILITKKLVWKKTIFDNILMVFLIAIMLSTFFISPNKIQALLNPHFGFVQMLSLVILFFYAVRFIHAEAAFKVISISATILAIIAVVFFFQPYKSAQLPYLLQFLQNPLFTPIGSSLDLLFYLGIFSLFSFLKVYKHINKDKANFGFYLGVFIINFWALLLTLYTVFKSALSNPNGLTATFGLPPFRLSWYAAVDILKYPINAAIGIGVDNFSTMFTHVKDILYNYSPLWQVETFNSSRSTFLHIFTETGLLGGISFILLVLIASRYALSLYKKHHHDTMHQFSSADYATASIFGVTVLLLILFPPSLPLFVLFFLSLAAIMQQDKNEVIEKNDALTLENITPLYIGIPLLMLLFVIASLYFLGKSYLAEYYFKKSIDGYNHNSLVEVYKNQQTAITVNPYIERFRINFAQTNLLLANNIATQATQNDKTKSKLTDEQRQTIAQGIQNAISEAKAAVTLNSQKAANWENLAAIYRNIIGVAENADVWTVSAYQRAMGLDPVNPLYPFSLGGVYYSAQSYDNAINLFSQSVNLKPDWSNSHYNLAWALYQKGSYQQAAAEMQNVLSLLNPTKDKADYDKATKELDQFKKKVAQEQPAESSTSGQLNKKLTLPSPAAQQIQPQLQLPKQASPEAK